MRDQSLRRLGVDGRVEPGHDDGGSDVGQRRRAVLFKNRAARLLGGRKRRRVRDRLASLLAGTGIDPR
jgi:hypothetical protein